MHKAFCSCLFTALFFSLLLQVGCDDRFGDSQFGQINPETGQPYLSADAAKALEDGASRQDRYMSDWREARARSAPASAASDDGRCERPEENAAVTLVSSYLAHDRAYRERRGNLACACFEEDSYRCGAYSCPRCRCEPMGDSCLANTCTCDEICPNNHGVLAHARERMNPDGGDQFAFVNSRSYNGTVFSGPGVGDGRCTGIQQQRRKWAALADFQDTTISYPAMTVGDDTWKSFMRSQIDRMVDGLNPHFLGISKLSDLLAHPDIASYFREKTGHTITRERTSRGPLGDLDSDLFPSMAPQGEEVRGLERDGTFEFVPPRNVNTVDTVREGTQPRRDVKVYFDQEGTREIPARTEFDRSTNPPTAIPSMHDREAYHRFMQNQTRRVSQGEPAIIPGFPNIHSISNQAPYAQIIGDAATRDWQDVNLMDDRIGRSRTDTRFHTDDFDTRATMAPNGADQNEHLLEQLRARLPVAPAGSYLNSGWNANGPYQGVSLEFMAYDYTVNKDGTARTPAATMDANGEYAVPGDIDNSDDERRFFHSVEVYALRERSDGAVEMCIANPNDFETENGDCSNAMVIPAPGANGRREGRIENTREHLQFGRVEMQPSTDAYQAEMTSNLISYCRQKNRGRSNCPGGSP